MRRRLPALFEVPAARLLLFPRPTLGEGNRRRAGSAGSEQVLTDDLRPVPYHPRADGDADAAVTARITLNGDQVTVDVSVRGENEALLARRCSTHHTPARAARSLLGRWHPGLETVICDHRYRHALGCWSA